MKMNFRNDFYSRAEKVDEKMGSFVMLLSWVMVLKLSKKSPSSAILCQPQPET